MNKNRYSSYSLFLLLIADLGVLVFLFFLFLFYHYPTWERSLNGLIIFGQVHYKALILLGLFWCLVAAQIGLYNKFRFHSYLDILKRVFFQILLFSIALFAISGIKKENLYTSGETVVFLIILFVYLLISRRLVFQFIRYYRRKGYNQRRTIIIDRNDNLNEITHIINDNKDLGLKIEKIFVENASNENELPFDEIYDYLKKEKIDFAYIALSGRLNETQKNQIISLLEDNYISIGFIPSTSLETRQTLEINYLDTFPILTYQKYPLDLPFNRFVKRVFDLIFTLIIFALLLWWLIPILSIAVWISQGRPVLFAQKRNGLNGTEFNCLKFRTMKPDKDNNKKPTEKNDPRVTKLGKILRKTSLDELPQFFNVLKGDMSIVGPRPHMVSENESYSDTIKKYSLRHYVKPGITGLAQIKGYRGVISSQKDMELRIKADIYYVRNWSVLLDLLIIYKTGKLMVFGDENAV